MDIERLITMKEVQEWTGLTRGNIFRLRKAGKFPEPLRIGPNTIRWKESTLTEWLATRPAAGDASPPETA